MQRESNEALGLKTGGLHFFLTVSALKGAFTDSQNHERGSNHHMPVLHHRSCIPVKIGMIIVCSAGDHIDVLVGSSRVDEIRKSAENSS